MFLMFLFHLLWRLYGWTLPGPRVSCFLFMPFALSFLLRWYLVSFLERAITPPLFPFYNVLHHHFPRKFPLLHTDCLSITFFGMGTIIPARAADWNRLQLWPIMVPAISLSEWPTFWTPYLMLYSFVLRFFNSSVRPALSAGTRSEWLRYRNRVWGDHIPSWNVNFDQRPPTLYMIDSTANHTVITWNASWLMFCECTFSFN